MHTSTDKSYIIYIYKRKAAVRL